MFHIFRRSENADGKSNRRDSFSDFTDQVKDKNTKIYIEKHLIPDMEYYSKQSQKSKRWYYFLSGLGILIGATISVLTALMDKEELYKLPLAILGVTSTSVNTLLALLGPKEQWLENRIIRENLRQYLLAYFMNAGIFAPNGEQKNKDQLLYETCEKEMAKGNNRWQMRNKKTDSGKQRGDSP